MIKNKTFGTKPVLAHGPGRIEHIPLWDAMVAANRCCLPLAFGVPRDLTVIVFNNGSIHGHNGKSPGLLESTLDRLEAAYTVLGAEVKDWKNKIKIDLAVREVEKVGTTHVLFCDSSDVFVLRDMSGIVDAFEAIGHDALFNTEKMCSPTTTPRHVVDFENRTGRGTYLNAGLWMARTEFAKKILSICHAASRSESETSCEQLHYKNCYFELHPRMNIDHGCVLFQGLNRCGPEEIQLVKIM